MKGDNLSNQMIKVLNGYSSLTLPRSIWLHLVGTLVDNCPQRRCYFSTGRLWVLRQTGQNQLKVPHRFCAQV